MKHTITKTVAIIAAAAVIIGIALCIAGAAGNGSLSGALGRMGVHEKSKHYDKHYNDYDDYYDDFFDYYDDFFDDDEDLFNEFSGSGEAPL